MTTTEWVSPIPNHVDDAPKIRLSEVEFSVHAIQRAKERGVSAEEIKAVIETPERAWISRKHEAWIFARGDISLGLREHRSIPDVWAVLTVIDTNRAEELAAEYEQARAALGWED